MNKLLFFCMLFSWSIHVSAQNDPEFAKGFIVHLKLHNGMITNFTSVPDLYVGGIQLVPQFTIVPHLLRIGVTGDGFYTDKKIQGAAGPVLSVKIKTLPAGVFGSLGNINISASHLWGSNHQRLIGCGFHADLGDVIVLGITAKRDYFYNNWWLENEIGIRISGKRKVKEPYNQ